MSFAWSYSKIKNYETCPRRYHEVDVLKRVQEAESDDLKWGNRVHSAYANYLVKQEPLPEGMSGQQYLDDLRAMPGQLYVEQKWAITSQFTPTSWFGKNDVWYRGIGDAAVVNGPIAIVRDWKTGKVKVDETQLMLTAQLIFIYFPEVQRVRADFVWLQEDPKDAFTGKAFSRREMAQEWTEILPRVNALEKAHADKAFPPKPGRLCRNWCPVKSCEYHGK